MVLFFEVISEMGNSCFPKTKSQTNSRLRSSAKTNPSSTVALNEEDNFQLRYLDDKKSEEADWKVASGQSVKNEKRAAIKEYNLRKLRNDLKKNPENFILNNLLLSVEFFKNYERDTMKAKMKSKEEEARLSEALKKNKNSCVLECPIIAIASEYISLIPKGEKQAKAIGSIQYTILQDQTEVFQESSAEAVLTSGYSKVSGTMRLVMEVDDTAPGYFLLRCLDKPKKEQVETGLTSPGSTDGSELYSKLSDYDPELRRSNPSSDESKAKIDDEGEDIPPSTSISPGREFLEQLEEEMRIQSNKPLIARPISAPNLSQISSTATDATAGAANYFQRSLSTEDPNQETVEKITGRRGREKRPPGIMPHNRVLVRRGSQFNIIQPKESQLAELAIIEDSETVAPLQTKLKRKDKVQMRNQSSESLISSEDSIYARIDDLRRPLPSRSNSGSHTILENCIKNIRMVTEDEEDDKTANPLGLLLNSNIQRRQYLSSHLFLAQFGSSTFHDYADRLKFSHLLGSAVVLPPSIYVHDYPEEGNSIVYTWTPGIQVPWPDTYFEWSFRNRQRVRDTRTGIVYKWPHEQTVELVRQQGCYLVPKGANIKGRPTAHADLQWKISFSKAESTLLSTLTHAQMRCLYWAFLLFEDQMAEFGNIDTKHILSIVFDMLEKNYGAWSEVNLADNLRLIFENLHACLSRRKLPNYFHNKQNMLRSCQSHGLRRAQERVFRILENLTPHILNIGKRLQSSLYPIPDLDKLRHILNNNPTSILAQINPALLPDQPAEPESRPKSEVRVTDDDDGFWGAQNKQRLSKMDPTRRYLKQSYKKKQAEQKAAEKAAANDDEEEAYTYRNKPLGRTQSQLLIEYFMDHFLELARRAVQYKSYREASMLLDHCDNLVVLEAELGFTDDTVTFTDEIARIRALFRKDYHREQKTVAGLDFQTKQRGQNWVLKKTEPLPDIPILDQQIKPQRSNIGKTLTAYPFNVDKTEDGKAESNADFTRIWVEAQFHKQSDSDQYGYSSQDIPNVSAYYNDSSESVIYDKVDNSARFVIVDGVEHEEESTDF